jgi:hypothetical protein
MHRAILRSRVSSCGCPAAYEFRRLTISSSAASASESAGVSAALGIGVVRGARRGEAALVAARCCRGAMGIAGGSGVKFCPDDGLGSSNRPFPRSVPEWTAQSAVVRDHRQLEIGRRGRTGPENPPGIRTFPPDREKPDVITYRGAMEIAGRCGT